MEELEVRRMLSVAPQVPGALSGKVMYTSGGHGFVWRPPTSTSAGYWGIMRTYINGMMEDMGNQDQLQPYADYLLHAGATVVSMRPVGQQVNEDVVDNSDVYSPATGGFQVVSGSWTGNTSTAPYWSNNNGNDTNHWMFAATATTETAVARFTANIPASGFYPVYAWTNPGTNNASTNDRVSDQIYRINYLGGSAEVKVAQNKTGNGWIYLGSYYFGAGVSPTSGSVEVSNKSATTGKYVVADGIRFGNGVGDWDEYGTHPISGQPRENECALYWCYDSRGWSGPGARVSDDVVDLGNNTYADENKNFYACDAYAAYMNNSNVGTAFDRLWISFHSNAGGGRGTLGLINSSPTPNQAWLAQQAGSTVQSEMHALDSTHEYAWQVNSTVTYSGGYSEISSNIIHGEFDATIIEVAFHDNTTDASLLKDPKVRWDVGRAAYHTGIQYFDNFDANYTNTTYLPEPPTDVRATTDASGHVNLAWTAGPSSTGTTGPYGNAATGYRIWTSTNGYGFDLAATVGNATSYQLSNLATNQMTYFRVTAINAGGESLASSVVVGKPQAAQRAHVLIVNNFSRLDRQGDKIESFYFGTVSRARKQYNNSGDYVVQAAEALKNFDSTLGVESCTDTAIASGAINLSDYAQVIWLSGEQSSRDRTFTSVTQPLVSSYLSAGGRLFVSGSDLGYDLVGQAHGSSFYKNTLHTNYVKDDAGKYATAAGTGPFASVPALAFDDGTHATYDVDAPDVISANTGAAVGINYSGGAGAALVYYPSTTSGITRVVNLAFPFESIYSASQRNALMSAVMNYFGASSASLSQTPGAVDLVAANDTGSSNTDDKTSRNNSAAAKTLQFSIAGTVIGATVTLYIDGIVAASALASTTTTTITTDGSTVLTDGTHSVAATQTEPSKGESLASAALSVTVDTTPAAAPGTTTISGSGTGIALDWADVAGEALWGYNVYRGSTGGGPYTKLTLSPIAASNYTDNTVAGGNTYYYVVTSVDAAGNESGNSPQAAANVFAWVDDSGVLHGQYTAGGGTMSLTVSGSNTFVSYGTGTFTFPTASFTSVIFSGASGGDVLNFSGPLAQPVAFNGGTGTDSIDIQAGTLSFAAGMTDPNGALGVSVSSGAAAVFNSTMHLRGLTISPTGASATLAAGGDKTLFTKALTVNGRLDLKDNDLVFDYTPPGSPLESVAGLIGSGRNGGDWLGPAGIVTTSAASNSDYTTLGVAEGSEVLGISGSQTALFNGYTIDASAVIVKYTYGGDANLDGLLNIDDYTQIDSSASVGGALKGWYNGDFNYDGNVDIDDYTIIDSNIGIQGAPL